MVLCARHFPLFTISLIVLGLIICNPQHESVVEAFAVPAPHMTPSGRTRSSNRHSTGVHFTSCFDRLALHEKLISSNDSSDEDPVQNRRKAMNTMSSAVLSGLLLGATSNAKTASAYEKTFPVELDTTDADNLTPRQRALVEQSSQAKPSPLESTNPLDLGIGAVLWGSALWFLAGSRSNPLATPLANLLYNDSDEEWLQDRNDGLFAALPAPLLLLLFALFLLFGFSANLAAITLTDGSVGISLQLAGVLLIGAGTLEIGRIASGEKKQTRSDFDRDAQLEREFEEFAEKRLKLGGNCHRSEVVLAFRRFYAKYRQADNTDYPLNDLEIERLLKQWNEKNAQVQRTSAGFYNGIQINTDADIFVKR